ncbi:MAG TPA: MBG domain-containing protein [Candidatus Cryosericum sp.]|nr:MBG domain-containing protein [Candidatus Cryosericum sp.]
MTANDKSITYPANRPAEATLNYTVAGEVGTEEAAFTGELAYQSGFAVQPAAGPHDEVIVQGDLALADNGTFKASNYSLSFVKGDLTVLAGTFTPTTGGYLGTYDGDPHGLTADVPGVTGETIWYSTSQDGPFSTTPPTFTDAGTYTVYFMATDPAGNYNDSSVQSGTVTILPATLTVTANDKSITYPAVRPDEAALDYVVSGEIGSEEAAFTGILGYVSTLGTNPLPGPYADAIVQGGLLLADNGTFKASNYTIDFVEGDLNVTSGTFSVSLTDASAVYNGSSHYATLNGTQSDDGIQYFVREGGVWVPVSYTPSVTNVNDGPKEIKVIVSRTGYTKAEATATLTITPVEVTVTADSRSMTYGDTTTLTPAEGVTYAGFVNGETSSVASGRDTITYTYKDGGTTVTVDNDLDVGSYSITPNIGGLSATNYTFKANDGTLAVGIATMTVDSLGYTGVYDGKPHDLVAEASVSGMTITYSTSADGDFTSASPEYTDAGTYTVYFKAVDPDGNYATATGSAQIKISKAVITATANDQSMTYGDSAATPAAGVSYSGFALGEDESVISGSAGFNYYNGSTEVFIDSALGAGSYTITPDLSGLTAANYTFTPANGTLTVNKAVLTVTAEDKIRTYGDTAPVEKSAVITGFVNGENIITAGVIGGVTYEYFNGSTEVTVDQYLAAGSYTIVPGVGELSSANYTFAPANGELTVSQKLLTVVPDDRSMTYGDTTTLTPAEGVTYQGFVNGDTAVTAGISGDLYYSYMDGLTPVTVNNTLPAKTYTIVPDIDDLLSDNYSFTQGSGTLTVNKATMTVDSTGYSGLYSGTPHDLLATASVPGMTITYSTSEDGTFGPICPSYTNAGTYTVYFKAVDPAGNYATATGHADIDIDQRMITATANDQSMTYGDTGTMTAAGVTYTGFVDGENETNIGLTGSVGYGYRDFTNWVSVNNTLAAGTYTIVPNVAGLSAPNYYFAPAAGTFNVYKKLVTVTADDRGMTYGDTTTLTPAEGVAYTGFANGDTESVVSGKDSITYTYKDGATVVTVNNTLDAGGYSIVPGVSGLSADNYTFAPANGALTVSKATGLAINATSYNDKYNGEEHGIGTSPSPAEGTTLLYSLTGGTDISAYTLLSNPMFKDAMSAKTVYVAAVNDNYVTVFDQATVTIARRTIKLASGSETRPYNGLPLSLPDVAVTGDGFVAGEGFVTDPQSTVSITNVSSVTNAYSYPAFIAGTNVDNYAFQKTEGTLEITAVEVTVTADDRSMTYGDTATLTPAEGVTYAGFITGENESVVTGTGSITYTYKDGSTVVDVNNTLGADSYSIVPGVGGLSATNYTFTPANGTLTVDPATMEVTSPGYEEYYDGVAHGLTASVTGLTGMTITYSDSATGTFTSASPEYTNAGTYTVYFKAVDPDGNYSEATGSADIVIHQVDVTVTADDQNMMYGDATAPAETVTYSGFVHGETAATSGMAGDVLYSYYDSLMFTVAVSSTLDAGLYTITPDVSGLTSTNYTFTPANGTLTVAKSDALTVEADDVTGAYNGSAYMVIPTASDLSGTDFWYSLTDSTDPADYSMTPPTLINVADSARVYLMATNLNYENAFGSALVTITPVELTVTPDDQYMTYGDAVLPTESSVITGYVNSENATLAGVTGTIGYSYFDGTTPVTVSSTLPAGDYTIEVNVSGLAAPNYTFTNASGALTVARSESLTVDATDISEMYNGGTHMVTPLASDMSSDTTIWYSLTNSTDPADYSTTAPSLINVGDSATVYLMATNPNYYTAFGDAEVDITTRVIALGTNSETKVYDATPLTNIGWDYITGNDGFIGTQGFDTAYATGTITNAGFVPNGFYYEFKTGTLTENYTVNVTEGVLTVTERPVVIVLDPAEKNSGDPDPAFTFHYLTLPGLYDVLPGTGITVILFRMDALAATGEDIGVHTGELSITVVFDDATAASNYAIAPQNADFTIHPKVTYNLNTLDAVTGFPATEWFDYLSDATIADATGVARLGYVLTGWTDTATGDPIALGATITGINRNYSLNAVWELAEYSIFYVPNTAMAVANMPGTQTDVPYTSQAVMSGLVPTRAGFTFVHWDTADVPGVLSLDPASTFPMPNNDVTFVAIWEPDLTPVYYHANGGQGGTIEDGPFATLTTVTVAGNGFTRPGYRFIGWSTTPNGGVSAQPGDTFMMPVLQVNYYAQWEQEFYTVTYIVNGGTTAGLDGAVPYAEYTNLAYGDAMPVPADPAQDGYNFDGWTTAVPATVPEGGLTIYGTMTAVTEPEVIPEEPTPLAGASWALLNLILAIATALGSVLMLIGLVGKKRKEELEGVVVRETKKHPVTRLMTLLPAIGGIVAFILTENMKNPMAFVDRWTILMAVIAVLQTALVFLGVKKDKDVDPEATK